MLEGLSYFCPLVMPMFRELCHSLQGEERSRSDEVNGKVHETLALAMDKNTAITCKPSSIFKDKSGSLRNIIIF